MGFIVPAIAAAIGLGTVGTAVLQIGAAIGLGFLARKLAPKPKAAASAARERGRLLQLEIDTNAARKVIFGRAATAGSLVYWQTTGTDNRLLQMVIAIADHECEGLVELWVDGKLREWNSETGVVAGYDGKLKVRFYNGTADQTVDTAVRDASGGRWTDDETGANVCYAVVEATADDAVFPGGIPQIVFVVDGAKLYDPRLDDTVGGDGDHRWDDQSTWEFSDNSAVAIYNVLRGFSAGGKHLLGLNAPADAVRLSDFEAAANACDEDVGLGGGGTEKRYRCGYVAEVSGLPNRETLEALIASMAGDVICSGGIYRIMAGVARSPVATLTDDDLIIDEPWSSEPRRPRSELTNAVMGSFADPERSYNIVPLPPRTSSADEATDGGIRLAQALDLPAVTSRTQGQRIMEIARKRARRQIRARGTLRARWFALEPGDWVTFTSTRRGYDGVVFEIDSARAEPTLKSTVSLSETDDGIDDWNGAEDELDDETASDLAAAGPTLNSVSGFNLTAITVAGDGDAQMPGLRATWTAITDPTVVAIRIEYRKQGDTVALERRVEDPSAGQYSWIEGIQGGLVYEARAIPVTQPQRSVEWTSWDAAGGNTATLKVDAAVASEVAPESIGADELDAQTLFELRLATAIASVQGSVAEQLGAAFGWAQDVGEAALSALVDGQNNSAQILTERTERVTATSALAQQITTAITAINGNTASISEIIESVDGLSAQWGVAININGEVVGLVRLDGDADASQFTVVANKFSIAHPDVGGGTPVPVFTVGDVGGETKAYIAGELIADAITAGDVSVETLSAISANLGEVTAGLLRSDDNLFRIDLDNKTIVIETSDE